MAVISPPSFLQFGSHSARSDRLTVAAMLQPGATPMVSRGGVRPSGDGSSLKVTAQSTPTNSVQVAAGTAFIPESDGSGVYVAHNDAAVTLTIANASTTQNRKDIVVMQVLDQEVSGSSNLAQLAVITGTSVSGTASPPVAPANSYNLGEINVPASSTTTIANSAITDRRAVAVALGGSLPVLSTALPANPYPGMEVYCSDDDTVRRWNATASAWRVISVYPLPGPVTVMAPSAVQAITSTTFANLPNRQFVDFTAAKAMYADVRLGAWVSAVSGADVRAGIGLTGATTGPGPGGALVDLSSTGTFGDVLYAPSGQQQQCSVTIPVRLNSGTTRVEVMAYRGNTSAVPAVNYAVLRVVPLRYI